MRATILIVLVGLIGSSCLKKIEEAESLNTNIFDPEYAGEKWFDIIKISTFTTTNNDFKVRIEYSIPETAVPKLRPSGLSITADCNQYETVQDSAELYFKGNYRGILEYSPDGGSEYCLDLGIYLWKEDTTINRFTECVSL